MKQIFFFLLLIGCITVGCKRNKFLTDASAKLGFSADTLSFDTLFTTIGSTTQYFKVYNPFAQKIKISDIRMQNGATSVFFMNVDGDQAETFQNVEIAAHDSIYVFVACKPNESSVNKPNVIYENVLFTVNGNQQKVTIEAWGQDAYFHKGESIQTTTWKNDKPHVLLGECAVDSLQTLTIPAGTKIFCHKDAYLHVFGKLLANGTKQDSIIFQGDRLEHFYTDLPGQWGGINFIRGCSNQCLLNHVIIKNATVGIGLGGSSIRKDHEVEDFKKNFNQTNMCDIKISHCKIYNCDRFGIFNLFSNITADNCLIYNCNSHCVNLSWGGISKFNYCTIVNFTGNIIDHNDPVLFINNYITFANTNYTFTTDAHFTNCIITGNIINASTQNNVSNNYEIVAESKGTPTAADFNYSFTNCFVQEDPSKIDVSKMVNCVKNSAYNTVFMDYGKDNFYQSSGGPTVNTGINITGITTDLNDKNRDAQPDMGCYEQ
jgi:hypothetical protein